MEKQNKTKNKYCIYARKSMEAEERQAISIESQLNEMKAIAERDNLSVVEIKTESHSAKNSGERPAFLEMIKDLQEEKYNSIITWNPDRLSRNAGDLGLLVDLMDKGMLFEIRTYGQVFTNSPNDKFLLMILCSQAKLENDNKGINVKRGLRAKAEMGHWPCSNAPIGYIKSNKINEGGIVFVDEERAPTIRKAFRKIAYENMSIYDLVKWLKEINFLHHTGKHVGYSITQAMLHNHFYYGRFEFPNKSGIWYKGIHKPLITKKLFNDTQEAIAQYERKKKYRLSKTAPFAFLRMIRCGNCGSVIGAQEKYKILKGTGEEIVYRYYVCCHSRDRGCRERIINEETLMKELYKILDKIEIDLIGMKESLDSEIDRFYKIQAFIDGKENPERPKEKKEYDLRKYAKTIFREGRIDEKREILKHLKGRLILKDKRIYLDKVVEN